MNKSTIEDRIERLNIKILHLKNSTDRRGFRKEVKPLEAEIKYLYRQLKAL